MSDEAIGYISKQLASTKKSAIRGRLEHYNGASSEYFLYLSSEHKNVKKMFSKNRWDELNQLDFQLSDTDRTLKELFKINYDQNVISLKEGDEFIAIKNGEIIIVVDDEDRENEGDFICAAECITPEIVNFMAVSYTHL